MLKILNAQLCLLNNIYNKNIITTKITIYKGQIFCIPSFYTSIFYYKITFVYPQDTHKFNTLIVIVTGFNTGFKDF